MPVLTRPDAEIYYEVHGRGYPLLIFAPGGLKSVLANWRHSPSDPTKPAIWMNPMQELSDKFTVVALDQRNAGRSRAEIRADHGWHTFAEDHLALMDHLGFRRFHVMGGCIGGTFDLTLCEMAPERVTAAVLQNPIGGIPANRAYWKESFATFAAAMRARDPGIDEAALAGFERNLFGRDFVFSVSRDFVRNCHIPMLLQPGSDTPHPAETSAEIEALAPNLEVQRDWKGPEHLAESIRRVTDFLVRHTPKDQGKAAA